MKTTAEKFLLWDADSEANFCVLGFLEGFADDYKLMKGDSVAKEWPKDATFKMDPDFKKQTKLADNLTNPNNVLVVSKALREFLIEQKVPNLEFLPVTILDHKKKVASRDYTIANLVTTQDCIDTKASGVTWNEINSDYIATMKRLVLNEKKIAKNARLFRATHLKTQIFVHADLFAAAEAKGFTNIKSWRLSDFSR